MKKILVKWINIISNLVMLLLLYLVFSQIIYLVTDITNNKGDLWLTADWLINYSNGFIRRGLLGEFLTFSSHFLDINLITFTSYFQASLMVLFITFSVCMYVKTTRSFVEKMLLCSPAFYIGFTYWTYRAAFRKELLLVTIFAFLLVLIQLLKTRKISAPAYLAIAISLYIIFGLSHEMIIFYSPFFIFLFMILYHTQLINRQTLLVAIIGFCSLSTLMLVLSFFYHGDENSWLTICSSLSVEKSDDFCKGAIYATSQTLMNALAGTKYNALYGDYFIYYPICILLACCPFIFIIFDKVLPIKRFVIISIVALTPLFIVGYDWGRWISIHVTLFTLLTFYLLQIKQAAIRPICKKFPILSCVIFIFYIFSWIIPHCCTYPKLGSIFIFTLFF